MECRTHLDEMLVAEPAALQGVGDSALAEHVRECAHCRSAAERLLAGNAHLDRWLSNYPTGARAVATIAASRRTGARRFGRALIRFALPAAAVLAIAVAVSEQTAPSAPTTDPDTSVEPAAALPDAEDSPAVVVSPGQNAVVFQTSDPKITVVWYFAQERGP